jgi:hypothetical protein
VKPFKNLVVIEVSEFDILICNQQYRFMCTLLMIHATNSNAFEKQIIPCTGSIRTAQMSQEERSIFWEVIISVILSKKKKVYMCHIPNRFRDRAISL